MPITTSQPVVVPASNAITFDTWWIARLYVQSDPGVPTTASVVYRLGRMDGANFVPYIDANGQPTEKLLQINDLFGLAATNTDVANTVNNLITTVGTLGKGQNVIS